MARNKRRSGDVRTMKRRKIFTPGRCIIYGILGILFCGWAIIAYLSDKDYSVTTLTSKTGYIFDIRTPYFSEITQLVYCQLRKDRKTIFYTMLGPTWVAPNKLKFTLIEDETGLVAITEQANPHVVLVILDLKQHLGFPFSDLGQQGKRKQGEELVQRLNKTTLGESFVLGEGSLGKPNKVKEEQEVQLVE